MQRYFVDKKAEQFVFTKEQLHHILTVTRRKLGDVFEVVAEGEVALVKIQSLDPFVVMTMQQCAVKKRTKKITLFYCLAKSDKIEQVVQKTTELGVDEIYLVRSSRCVMKIPPLEERKKIDRYQKIAIEASEQCRRDDVPLIRRVLDFKELSSFHFDSAFIAYENETDVDPFLTCLQQDKSQSIAVLVGAEGGFSEDEVLLAKQWNFQPISLGKRILRSETACYYVMSVIAAYWG